MSLINDMLSDMKRRDRPTTAPNKEPEVPKDSQSKFNSTVMYNPYSQAKKLAMPTMGFDWRTSKALRAGLFVSLGALLATGIHFGTKKESSFLSYAMANDPFYVVAKNLYHEAYQLFQPDVYFSNETSGSGVLTLPQRPVFVHGPSTQGKDAQWVESNQEQPSDLSAWVGSAVGKFLNADQMPAEAAVPTPSVKAEQPIQKASSFKIAEAQEPAPYIAGLSNSSDRLSPNTIIPVLEKKEQGLELMSQTQQEIQEGQSAERLFAPKQITMLDNRPEGLLVKNNRTESQLVQEGLESSDGLQLSGRVQEAEQTLFELLQQFPKNTELRVALTNLYLNTNRFEDAEKIIKVGRYLNPRDQSYTRLLARVFASQDSLDKAIGILLENPPRIQEQPEHYSTLAAIYQKQGRHDLAIQLYWDLVELFPESGQWWAGLGISSEASNSSQQAVDSYIRALGSAGLQPKLRGFVNERVKVLSQNGRVSASNRTPDRSEYQLK